MKYVLLISLILAMACCDQVASVRKTETMKTGLWWTYLADYDGLPGSVVVDLALKPTAPASRHNTLLVTGISYSTRPDGSGLPSEAELDFLSGLGTERLELISKHFDAILVGSFTHDGERLDYFYVTDATGLDEALKHFYESECPDRQIFTQIKSDAEWDAYLNFLYPNAATIEHYRSELVALGAI